MDPHAIKKRLYRVLNFSGGDNKVDRIIDLLIMILIAVNALAVVLETVPSIHNRYIWHFHYFYVFSMAIFSLEYVLRIWCCTVDPRYSHPVFGRIRFALHPLVITDLLAIMPLYLPFVSADLRFVRSLRLFRVFRVMRIQRYSQAVNNISRIIQSRREELTITVMVLGILLLFSSSIMYLIENSVQPDKFSSIPMALWWAVITLTTVGYGDIYPITPLGRFFGGIVSILGISLFALPAGIIASGFVESARSSRRPPERCPHCGRTIDRQK